jgi:hypothetical protein
LKRTNLLSNAAAGLLKTVVVCVVIAASSAHAAAQTRAGDVGASARPTQTSQSTQPTRAGATADEEFDLNIEQRRISEGDFHAETAVEAEGARGLRLGVGVALRASDIEAQLFGVRGHVRFRGSLAPVLRLLEARRVAPAQAPPP